VVLVVMATTSANARNNNIVRHEPQFVTCKGKIDFKSDGSVIITSIDGDYVCTISKSVLGLNRPATDDPRPFKICMMVDEGKCQVVGISSQKVIDENSMVFGDPTLHYTEYLIDMIVSVGEANPYLWTNPALLKMK
jgi:hypothetical protein